MKKKVEEDMVKDITGLEHLQGNSLRIDGFFRGEIDRIYLEGNSIIIQTDDGTILAIGE